MDAKQRRYDGIDFDQLYKRLRVYAEGLTRFMPEVFDGVSAGDLVNDVLLAFWESPEVSAGSQPKESLSRSC